MKDAAVVSVVESFLEGGECSVFGNDVYFGDTVRYHIISIYSFIVFLMIIY